jgi:hypothetical protein
LEKQHILDITNEDKTKWDDVTFISTQYESGWKAGERSNLPLPRDNLGLFDSTNTITIFLLYQFEDMANTDKEWELEEGIPQFEDPFIQQYLKGRDALIVEEQKRRHGTSSLSRSIRRPQN